jgi:uncharacterized phage protein (TIGR02220 family)
MIPETLLIHLGIRAKNGRESRMSKQTPFFKFDAMQWLGGAIQNCTLEEKGLFIDLCALYWKHYKPVKVDAKFKVRYRNLEGTLSDLIGTLSDLGFIIVSEAGITVKFLDELMDDRQEFLQKCSKAGKKSASTKGTSTNKKEECRKKNVESRDKKEEDTPNPKGLLIKEIIEYLNETCDTKYRPSSQNCQKHISARIAEGFTVDDFKEVIKKKFEEWQNTEQVKYLRPETLFGTKFESYLNQMEFKADSQGETQYYDSPMKMQNSAAIVHGK